LVANLGPAEFVGHSLELNLFFLRIMKEHAIFIAAGFPTKDKSFIERADRFKNDYESLLAEATEMADRHIRQAVPDAQDLVPLRTKAA